MLEVLNRSVAKAVLTQLSFEANSGLGNLNALTSAWITRRMLRHSMPGSSMALSSSRRVHVPPHEAASFSLSLSCMGT
jgi:hypothetical protein